MPQVLGVHIQSDELCFARFSVDREEAPSLLNEFRVSRGAFKQTAEDGSEVSVVPEEVRRFLDESEDAETVAAFDPRRCVAERGTFPFKDPRKIEQVAPLQLEEELPFDLNGFLLESTLESPNEAGEYPALLVAIPEEEVAEQMELLKLLGLDPAVLAPTVVGLGGIASQLPEVSASLVSVDENRFSFTTMKHGAVAFSRDCPVSGEEAALSEILPTVLSARRALGEVPLMIYSIGRKLRFPVDSLKTELLSAEKVGLGGKFGPIDRSIASLLGLAIARVRRRPLPNFRKGQFRYRGSYRQISAPLWEERRYGAALAFGLFFWLGMTLYASAAKRSLLDERINVAVQKVFPGESIPEGQELSFVQTKVSNLEQRLKGLGSVSSLSPLEAFRELSQIISSNVDVAFDSVSITPNAIAFGGTVADTGTVGRLIGALEKHQARFCSVKVEPRGGVPGGGRVRIVAELKYCP